jgi:hypothetical protein
MLAPEFWQAFGASLTGVAVWCLIILGVWTLGGLVFAVFFGKACRLGRPNDE